MKIIIVDDHPLVRKGLSSVLSLESENELVGEAANVADAEKIIFRLNPDLAIIDLRLGNEYGLDIVKKVKEGKLGCKFLVLTSSGTQCDFQRAEEVGVDGYVLKEALPDELLYAIRIIGRGRKYYDPELVDLMVNGHDNDFITERLTPRELDVLEALGKGLKNNEIAKQLFITEFTVKKHVSQILDKLGLSDRTQAALYANNIGLVKY